MADLKLDYKDAEIHINAGLGGLHWVDLSCRGVKKRFLPDQLNTDLMAILYPGVDQWAKDNGQSVSPMPDAPPLSNPPGGCISPPSS